MKPEESLELLREAHRKPVDEAHFAAVRARVLAEIVSERRGARRVWWFAFAGVVAVVLVAGLSVKGPGPSKVVRGRVTPSAAKAISAIANTAKPVDRQIAASPRHAGRKPGGRAETPAPQRAIVGPRISQPLVVKMVTDDPDVVIYWITEGTGE